MTDYWVDDGGSNTAPFDTRAKAATSWDNLVTGASTALTTSGNRVFVVYDHNDPNKAADWGMTLPTGGLPVQIISVDAADTPTYRKGTGNQVSALGGTYKLTLTGAFACYGVRFINSATTVGTAIAFVCDYDEPSILHDCTLVPGAGGVITLGGNSGRLVAQKLHIDLSADASSNRANNVINAITGAVLINGLTFTGGEYRIGNIFATNTSAFNLEVTGADFSGFTNVIPCEIYAGNEASVLGYFSNCLFATDYVTFNTTKNRRGAAMQFVDCGAAGEPKNLAICGGVGDLYSLHWISRYRTGGAKVENTPTAWLVTTMSYCSETAPFYTPWINGVINSTGQKTFDLYIVNDTADFYDNEVWMEVEYLGTSGNTKWGFESNQRSNNTKKFVAITTTSVLHTDDTESTWVGADPNYTYKQKLSVTATINATGMFRARVCVGVTSLSSSRYFYIDPKVTVT